MSLEIGSDDLDQQQPKILLLTDEAATAFQEWREDHRREVLALSGAIAAAWAKQPGQLLRLALILEFLWWVGGPESAEPDRISKDALLAAAALITDYFGPMAMRVYGDAALPEADRLAATLARWVMKTNATNFNARTLRREIRLPGLTEAAKVKVAIEALEEAGWVKSAPTRQGETAGRRSSDYVVNPRLVDDRHE
jgi:hypothetical protein